MEVWGTTNGEDVPSRAKGLKDYRKVSRTGEGEKRWGGGKAVHKGTKWEDELGNSSRMGCNDVPKVYPPSISKNWNL